MATTTTRLDSRPFLHGKWHFICFCFLKLGSWFNQISFQSLCHQTLLQLCLRRKKKLALCFFSEITFYVTVDNFFQAMCNFFQKVTKCRYIVSLLTQKLFWFLVEYISFWMFLFRTNLWSCFNLFLCHLFFNSNPFANAFLKAFPAVFHSFGGLRAGFPHLWFVCVCYLVMLVVFLFCVYVPWYKRSEFAFWTFYFILLACDKMHSSLLFYLLPVSFLCYCCWCCVLLRWTKAMCLLSELFFYCIPLSPSLSLPLSLPLSLSLSPSFSLTPSLSQRTKALKEQRPSKNKGLSFARTSS